MWRRALHELVATGDYGTQAALIAALIERGHTVDQSTVSRELRARGVQKLDGRYVPRARQGVPDAAPVIDAQVAAGGPLIVLRTATSAGPLLARAIDDAGVPGVIGTLAGDDTVFVATSTFDAVAELERLLGRALRA